MTLTFAIFTFINAWAVALFLAFPFSIEMPEKAEGVDYVAAPKKIHWKKLVVIATVIAALFTLALAIVIKSGIVPLRNME
jgi:predicted secreted protein